MGKKVEIVDENNVSCLRFLPFICAKKEIFYWQLFFV